MTHPTFYPKERSEIQSLRGETQTKVAVPGDGAIQGSTENDSLQGSTENDSVTHLRPTVGGFYTKTHKGQA